MKQAISNTATRDSEIVKLTRQGLSAEKIRQRLKLTITTHRIQDIAAKHVGRVSSARNSIDNAIGHLRPHIEYCLDLLGKDPYMCEICGERQDKRCDIHHTRYEGATIYDLQYVCRSCNLSRVNKGLK